MPQFPGQPHPYPAAPPGRGPGWYRRLGPGGRAGAILGGSLLTILLLCCTGAGIVGALSDAQPKETSTDRVAGQEAVPAAEEPVAAPSAPPATAAPIATPSDPAASSPAASSPAASSLAAPTTAAPTPRKPVVATRTETETRRVAHGTRTVQDSSLAKGKRVVRTRGVDGVRTLTYRVTLTDGQRTGRTLVRSVVTRQPVTEVVAVGTKQEAQCHPNYGGCVPIASDVDCAGGGGNGPAYVSGPIRVIGEDVYGLDRDKDGVACED
ncbi:G5 domain-containing protein [Micromonospora sp. PLK6-60]|uniref:G5 domain-containing protein n=1 Tax=Micromonospora sp. PLK6-60 TaxID=2873383 RepID=UPI001CA73879|nr:G5 domain-containing protein [Micromonospora sp. PLK6-60]MBY8872184.1 G5 domain-containing protein [Micromonospora sp. PLK6-60]